MTALKELTDSTQLDAIQTQDEDTPDKIEWFKRGIQRRREEFGWILPDNGE